MCKTKPLPQRKHLGGDNRLAPHMHEQFFLAGPASSSHENQQRHTRSVNLSACTAHAGVVSGWPLQKQGGRVRSSSVYSAVSE